MTEKIIGIDLGTSNSAAAVLDHGRPTIIPSAEGTSLGGKAFPSVVAFTKDGQRLVGEPARRQAISNPERTVTAIKRKMGTRHRIKIDDKKYSPEEISSMILRKIREDAENFLGNKIEKAVITVPAKYVLSVIEEAGKKGVKGVIIITSGFGEVGNKELEQTLVDKAAEYGVRILGPNIVGTLSNSGKLNASFAPILPLPGKGALVSQSGALLIAMDMATFTRLWASVSTEPR